MDIDNDTRLKLLRDVLEKIHPPDTSERYIDKLVEKYNRSTKNIRHRQMEEKALELKLKE